jgi:hypothetical protein
MRSKHTVVFQFVCGMGRWERSLEFSRVHDKNLQRQRRHPLSSQRQTARELRANATVSDEEFMGMGEVVDIDELKGVRVRIDDDGRAIVEYLVKWKVSTSF